MSNPQSFPTSDVTIIDQNGMLSLPWLQFFAALWNRTGSTTGNQTQLDFGYPTTAGTAGQVLTSHGSGQATTWTTLATRLSQFSNDTGYITSGALTGLATTAETATSIASFVLTHTSQSPPLADAVVPAAGVSLNLSRADHVHPFAPNPRFVGTVSAGAYTTGGAVWIAGAGPPTGIVQAAGSLYSNTAGAVGARLWVSSGAGWTAVPGV